MLKKLALSGLILALGLVTYSWMNEERTNKRPIPTVAASTATERSSDQTERTANGNRPPPTESTRDTSENQSTTSQSADNRNSSEASSQNNRQGGPPRGGIGGTRSGRLAQQAATSVEVQRARLEQQNGVLTLFGVVEPQTSIRIAATSAATVTERWVDEGTIVSAGVPIISLNSPSALEQLTQRQAALTELNARIRNEALKHDNDEIALSIEEELVRISKNAVDRFNSLNAQQLSSNTDYESALRTYQNQRLSLQNRQLTIAQYENTTRQLTAQREGLISQIRQTQQIVDELNVTAPFTGRVAILPINTGDEVRSGDVIAELYDPESIALYVSVPVRYRLDQAALDQLIAEDDAGQRWRAVSIRTINESGAQRLTLVPLESSTLSRLPGTHVEITLSYPLSQPTINVPVTAVYDQQRVYVFDRDTQATLAVDIDILGRSKQGYLIHSDDLNPRQPIITTRMKNPVTGTRVAIVRPEGARP